MKLRRKKFYLMDTWCYECYFEEGTYTELHLCKRRHYVFPLHTREMNLLTLLAGIILGVLVQAL